MGVGAIPSTLMLLEHRGTGPGRAPQDLYSAAVGPHAGTELDEGFVSNNACVIALGRPGAPSGSCMVVTIPGRMESEDVAPILPAMCVGAGQVDVDVHRVDQMRSTFSGTWMNWMKSHPASH